MLDLATNMLAVRAIFIIGRQTIVIIHRHQVGVATVKVTADLQLLFKNAIRDWVGNQRKIIYLWAVTFKR